jgi:hypothetical protein
VETWLSLPRAVAFLCFSLLVISSGWKPSRSIGTEPHRLFGGFVWLPDPVFCHAVDGLDI